MAVIISEVKGHVVIWGSNGDGSKAFVVLPDSVRIDQLLHSTVSAQLIYQRLQNRPTPPMPNDPVDVTAEVLGVIGDAIEKHSAKLKADDRCDCGSPRCTWTGSAHCWRGIR